MWSDTETDNDFLNYSEVADLTAELVANPNLLPLSLGIYGGWGAGKSSLLKLIKTKLSKSAGTYLNIHFDAWLYQDFDDARAALMDVIAQQLIKRSEDDKTLLTKIKDFSQRINIFRVAGLALDASAIALGVPTLGICTSLAGKLEKLTSCDLTPVDIQSLKAEASKARDQLSGLINDKPNRSPAKEIDHFRQDFSEILESLNITLVVYIDNLDRCLPQKAIQTLEAVRLFLFMPKTAFIVAADEDMIRFSVSEHFGQLSEKHKKDYLDKLVQIPIRVPQIGLQELRGYLYMLFISLKVREKEAVESARGLIENSLRQAWKGTFFTKHEVLSKLPANDRSQLASDLDTADRLSPILVNSRMVNGNPRIVKRLLNVVSMRISVAKRRNIPVDESLITKFALFERCTDEESTLYLFNLISSTANGKPKLIEKLERFAKSTRDKLALEEPWSRNREFIEEWFRLPPSLEKKDLRPLLYLSKETASINLSDDSLSPKAILALEALIDVQTTASRGGKKAIQGLSEEELQCVMDGLVRHLKENSNWQKRPRGIAGATILANASNKCALQFRALLEDYKEIPWVKAQIKQLALA